MNGRCVLGTEPRLLYSASKAGSGHLVRAWHHTRGLPMFLISCSNNYWPYHFPEKLIPLIIETVRWYLDNRSWWQAIQAGTYRGERLGAALD